MFKPFQCIPILGHGVELQDIIILPFLNIYHCNLAMKNKPPMTSLSPPKYEQAGSSFKSEYLASKPRIKMSIINANHKASLQTISKAAKASSQIPSEIFAFTEQAHDPRNTGMVTEGNCSQRWQH